MLKAVFTFSPLELCERGDYKTAAEMAGLRAGEWPENVSEGILAHAEALLVAGVITSVAGGIQQAGAQTVAKEMLTEAIRLFGSDPRSLLARYRLARAENWDGQLARALKMANELLPLNLDSATRLRTLLLRAEIYCVRGLLDKAFADTEAMAAIYEEVGPQLKGQFHNQRGWILRKMNEIDRAVTEYDSAIHFFRQAGDVRCEAIASNNLSHIYLQTECFTEAHEYADRAQRLFCELGDKTFEAKARDQRALIFMAEGKLTEAEESIAKAMGLVCVGEILTELSATADKIKQAGDVQSGNENATMRRPRYASPGAESHKGNAAMTPTECASRLIQNDSDNAAVLYDLLVYARMPNDPEHDAEMDGIEEMLFSKTDECINRREDYRRSRLVHPISDS